MSLGNVDLSNFGVERKDDTNWTKIWYHKGDKERESETRDEDVMEWRSV